jgi:hypothetical protein
MQQNLLLIYCLGGFDDNDPSAYWTGTSSYADPGGDIGNGDNSLGGYYEGDIDYEWNIPYTGEELPQDIPGNSIIMTFYSDGENWPDATIPVSIPFRAPVSVMLMQDLSGGPVPTGSVLTFNWQMRFTNEQCFQSPFTDTGCFFNFYCSILVIIILR